MPVTTHPEWQQMALWAVGAAVVLFLLFRIPRIGGVIRGAFSLGLMALFIFVMLRQAPFEPTLARLTERLGLSGQTVVGDEVRIRMSPDGHFWAAATINGVPRRMLIDSGATVTALSEDTAQAAAVEPELNVMPVVLRTANGAVAAKTGSVDRLTLGGQAESVEARDLKVVITPALGPVDVLGMNFLSQLASWRVEGRTLILTPKAEKASPPPA